MAESRTSSADATTCSTLKTLNSAGEELPSEEIDACRYYRLITWTKTFVGGPLDGIECNYQTRYVLEEGCSAYFDEYVSGPPECGSGSASVRSNYSYSNEVLDSEYTVFSPPQENPPLESEGGHAYEFISKNGIWKARQEETMFIRHTTSPACYLAVWVRLKLQNWKLRDAADPSGSGPKTAEVWCNDFVVDGAAYWSEQEFPVYTWSSTGNPCFPDPSKLYNAAENYIDSRNAATPWSHQVQCAAEGSGKGRSVAEVQIKVSYLDGYEPPWPSE